MDAAIRLLIGVAFVVAAAVWNQRPFLALGAGALAALMLGTGLTRSCPLYVALGLNTLGRRNPRRA